MPRYAFGAGLIDQKNHLTPFGELAVRADPLLEQPATQWLMHYFLSAPHGPGPAFWHDLVVSHLRPGNDLTKAGITAAISGFVERTEGKSLGERTTGSTATIFLGTYSKSDGLGYLGFLEEQKGSYRVQKTSAPPTTVLAVALADFWQSHHSERLSINLDDLMGEQGLADIFQMSQRDFEGALRELQSDRIIDIHRTAPPYQVFLLQNNPTLHLAKLYGNDAI
ncbi:MAG: DUF4007 family protein [Ardenticatenales bacterium]|nr:DUF4007 family protein [Ardenticatenales bacterium]